MDKVVHLCELQCGLQLLLDLKVIFFTGKHKILRLIFGPFRTERDIESWKETFLEEFLKTCKQIPEVDDCVKAWEKVDDFDPENISVFRPDDVRLLSDQIINLYFEQSSDPECHRGLSNRYYEWEARLRFGFSGQGDHEVKKIFSPIHDISGFRRWWKMFKKSIRETITQMGHIRFKELEGNFFEIKALLDGEEYEEDFFEIMCWEPSEYAQVFLKEIFAEWRKKANNLK